MHQFSETQIAHFRRKLAQDDSILRILDEGIAPVRAHYQVPDTGIATWGGFYACPKHSVNLVFDIADPLHYRCPVDGEVFTGAPYEGAWWRQLNDANERACQMSALRYMLLGEEADLALARRILVDYATRYPGYEIHGGIPYNKPGKANAQTLCDAQWLKGLAAGYDIIRDALSQEDRALIERDLFHCGAAFLMEHRTNQIHNHECIVDSAMGILSILLAREDYLDFALESRYGLKYQLEHGTLRDGFWFEGTPSYHFYAMQQFIQYERFAREGAYSFFSQPRFCEVLKFPMRLMQPDGTLPLLNDAGNSNRGFVGATYLYELAYARTGDEDFARILHLAYQDTPRMNVHAFFDGVDKLPPMETAKAAPYHAGQEGDSGLTTMMGADGRFLLVKHSPYGGEHDHYDRLALHFIGLDRSIAPDIGTTQYGAPLHYAYYKNTASHNTVCIDGQNQPPANCNVRSFSQADGVAVLDTEVRWDDSYVALDSFTIKQWSDEAYCGAVMRRHITWYGDFFVDCFDVRVPESRKIDWTLHVRGERVEDGVLPVVADQWADVGAGQYLHDVVRNGSTEEIVRTTWRLDEGAQMDMFTLCDGGVSLYYALGPDNPSVSDLSYAVERVEGMTARFVNVVCASRTGAGVLAGVSCLEEELLIARADGGEVRYTLPEIVE